MFFSTTNTQVAAKVLKHLKNEKSSGQNGISNEKLMCCSPSAYHPILAEIFNESNQRHTQPTWLKSAKNSPLFKKGERSRTEHYRSITFISSHKELFAKLLLNRMMPFRQKHEILNESQTGFSSKMSSVQAIAKVTDFISQQIDEKLTREIYFKYLKKAFDTLDY